LTSKNWHEGSASVVLLPSGETGAELIKLVSEWTKSWMLKPAFWISEADIVDSSEGPPRIFATIIGRNGLERIDLFSQLTRLDINNIRVLAARVVGANQKTDKFQDRSVSIIEKYIEQSRPIKTRSDNQDSGIKILKVNLVFAPTEQKGASFTDLLESHWDINLVVAPEDRATPTSFDGFTRYADKEKMNGFILSNIASTAGLWSGQKKSIFELSTQFSDLSPIQSQVRVMRTFVRGILSEGLAVKVAVEALKQAGKAETSKLSGRAIPNKYLIAYEGEEVDRVINEMLDQALSFQNGALKYQSVSLEVDVPQKATGVLEAIKFFFRSTWSLVKILPLWIFAALWNFLARLVTARLFGSRGREVAKGTIDFPKTDLDKDSARNLLEIKERRQKILEVLSTWPKNILRKSEPRLWEDLRKLVIGRLDGSSLPNGMEHTKDSVGIRVLGDLNQVLPSLHEQWQLPSNLARTLDSEPRKATWRDMEILKNLENFLKSKITQTEEELNLINSKIEKIDAEVSTINTDLEKDKAKIEGLQVSKAIKGSEVEVNV